MKSIKTKLVDKSSFFHNGVGAVQVIDDEAIRAMVKQFKEDQKEAGFAGLSMGLDHLNDLTQEQKEAIAELGIPATTEAVAWITDVEEQADGLYGIVANWTEEAWNAIQGGAYKFVSPVFAMKDALMLEATAEGTPQFRPLRLNSAAFTNSPRMGWSMRVSLNAESKGHFAGNGTVFIVKNAVELANDKTTTEKKKMEKQLSEYLASLGIEIKPDTDLIAALTAKVAEMRKMIDDAAEKDMEDEAQAVAAENSIKDIPEFVKLYKGNKEVALGTLKLFKPTSEQKIDKSQNALPTVGQPEKKVEVSAVDAYMKAHPGVSREIALNRLA